MSAHTHREYVEGCYRCDLGRDEERHAAASDHVEAAARAEFRRLLAQYEDGWRCDMPLSPKQFEVFPRVDGTHSVWPALPVQKEDAE